MDNSRTSFSSSKVGLIDGFTLIKLPVNELAQVEGPTKKTDDYTIDRIVRSETYDDVDGFGVNYAQDDMLLIDRISMWQDRSHEWENEVNMFS